MMIIYPPFHSILPSALRGRCLVLLSEFPELVRRVSQKLDVPVPPVPSEEKVLDPKRYILTALRHGNEDWYVLTLHAVAFQV